MARGAWGRLSGAPGADGRSTLMRAGTAVVPALALNVAVTVRVNLTSPFPAGTTWTATVLLAQSLITAGATVTEVSRDVAGITLSIKSPLVLAAASVIVLGVA